MWVLVIDDVVSNTVYLTEALRALDHRTVAAHDARVALTLLDQMAFDCVLVDFHMPNLNGAAFLTALQAKLATSDRPLPVIVMTADTSPHLVTEVRRLGAMAVLHKPIGISQLANTLNSLP